MKSSVKKIFNSEFGITLRNTFNFRPIFYKNYKANYPTSQSDAFLWRTDNGYKTKFKFSDFLNQFFKIQNSWVELNFFTKNNKFIKKKKIENLDSSNEFDIDSRFLDGMEDYGIFYIYHFSKFMKNLEKTDTIRNVCYTGYSKDEQLYSFVHGNTLSKFAKIDSNETNETNPTNTIKRSFFLNQKYTIQKLFINIDKNELVFVNPTPKKIKFVVENKKHFLEPHNALLIETTEPILTITSNCTFLRPTVFSYKNKFVDVHHS